MEESDPFLEAEGNELFDRLLAHGRGSSIPFARLWKRPAPILDLKTLVELVRPETQVEGQTEDVKVREIIGTEARSGDFTEGYYPRHAWMKKRWVKVYALLRGPGIPEPLSLIEYGGLYFVRDGNHRASVALHTGIEFVRASVIHYRIPIRLPAHASVKNLAVFKEKFEFHRRTGFFDYVKDADFNVNLPKTWKRLEHEVFVNCYSWMRRTRGLNEVDTPHLIHAWLSFYKASVEHIRSRGFMTLFPGMLETDVFVELVDYWNSYDDPDSLWVGEVYDRFERSIRRRHLVKWLVQEIALAAKSVADTPESARRFFLSATRLDNYILGFKPPSAGKAFYRLCYRQIFQVIPKIWLAQKHRQPSIYDVSVHWHARFYAPVVESFRRILPPTTFESYYVAFSKRYFEEAMSGARPIDECLDEFEKPFK